MRIDPVELAALAAGMLVVGGVVGGVAGGILGSIGTIGVTGTVRAMAGALRRQDTSNREWRCTWNARTIRLVRAGQKISLWIENTKVAEHVGPLPVVVVVDIDGGRIAAEITRNGGTVVGRIYANGEWIGGDEPPDPSDEISRAGIKSIPPTADPRWALASNLLRDLRASSTAHAPEAAHHVAHALRLLLHRLDRLKESEVAHAVLGTPDTTVDDLRASLDAEITLHLDRLREIHLQVLAAGPRPSVENAEQAVARVGAQLEVSEPLVRTPTPPERRTRGPLPDRAS